MQAHGGCCTFLSNFKDETPTSGPCQWTIPKKTKDYSQGTRIQALFPSKINTINILGIHPMTLLDRFANLDCPLFTVLQKERQLNTELSAGNPMKYSLLRKTVWL